jgi:hypothetical protein
MRGLPHAIDALLPKRCSARITLVALPPFCAKLIAPPCATTGRRLALDPGNSISRFFALAGRLSDPVKRLKSAALNVAIGERRMAYFSFVSPCPPNFY